MGQRELLRPDAQMRISAQRRRIILGLGTNDRAATVFVSMHEQFAPTP
jgi:hypothetical protein